MKKIFLFLFVSLYISINVFAQVDYFYISNDLVTKPCPFKGPLVIPQLKDWIAYQTIDGKIDSDIDTTVSCIVAIKDGFRVRLNLENIDSKRPLYVKPSSNKNKPFQLLKNSVFSCNISIQGAKGIFAENLNCDSSYCNNISMTLRSLAENQIDYIERDEVVYSDIRNGQSISSSNFDFCFPTSKVDTQFIENFVLTFVFDSTILSQSPYIFFGGLEGNTISWIDTVSADLSVFSGFSNIGVIDISLWDLEEFHESILLLHSKDGYPSSNNIDTKYFKIVPNLSTKTIINLSILEFQNLFIQDFVQLSPELVEGSDSIYHEFNIIQDGESVCIFGVERIFRNTNYVYKNGKFNLDGSSACMLLLDGSKLVVDNDSELKYGNTGNGILAINDGSVEVKEDGKLVFDGKIFLRSQNENHSTITLKTGAELSFTTDASIINRVRENEKLLIKGFPYQVDMTNLKQEYRDKIVFEIPEVDKKSELVIYPNPAFDNRIHVPSKYNNTDYSIHNLSGRIIQTGKIQNSTIDLSNLKSEIMILKIGNEYAKIIRF